MPRIQPVDVATAPESSRKVLEGIQRKLGRVPNILATMAQSPALTQAYLGFSGALKGGVIPAALGEQIALAVGQASHCDYCVAAHSAIGRSVGLTDAELEDARRGEATDASAAAALRFARAIVESRGFVTDADLEEVCGAGFSDEEIVEIVGHVALSLFTNYFNHIAQTVVDFPAVAEV